MTDYKMNGSLIYKVIQWTLLPVVAFLTLQVWNNSRALANGVPPKWFEAQVKALEAKLDRLTSDMTDLRVSLAEISANRFTSGDGLEVWREIADLRAEITELKKE